ncbi:hypothetical protein [Pedobacter sp. JY14-1]|uniref:hypothetical protein n=1 Tax=Pedobacter sp. JY14-1 TaxID=3034151 RepID=UPI0023E0E07C|nr:hypothetical protein [Pedobacter sp. JY14-1]
MKYLNETVGLSGRRRETHVLFLFFGLLALLWPVAQRSVQLFDPLSGGIDPNIWLLILLSLITFLLLAGVVWWLLKRCWTAIGLPQTEVLMIQFKKLELWQQLGFYLGSFAWLLFVAALCLLAIC